MKIKLTLTLASILLLINTQMTHSQHLLEKGGDGAGNGGGAIVCRDSNKQIVSASLLDVWEGRRIQLDDKKQMDLKNSMRKVENYLLRELPILGQQFRYEAPYVIKAINDGLSDLYSYEARLEILLDSNKPEFPKDCSRWGHPEIVPSYEQAVNYVTQNEIYIDAEIVKHFDSMSFLGIHIHEIIYKIFREYLEEKNSKDARKITAYLLKYASGDLSEKELNTIFYHLFNPPRFSNYTWDRKYKYSHSIMRYQEVLAPLFQSIKNLKYDDVQKTFKSQEQFYLGRKLFEQDYLLQFAFVILQKMDPTDQRKMFQFLLENTGLDLKKFKTKIYSDFLCRTNDLPYFKMNFESEVIRKGPQGTEVNLNFWDSGVNVLTLAIEHTNFESTEWILSNVDLSQFTELDWQEAYLAISPQWKKKSRKKMTKLLNLYRLKK
ncbi:MAG: hypothetical protein QE271_07075 [Bacteriovoracaceae bacterium]|nr:hypothetical protein [Bacteriovoracaceae bacterium]